MAVGELAATDVTHELDSSWRVASFDAPTATVGQALFAVDGDNDKIDHVGGNDFFVWQRCLARAASQ